MSLIKIILWIAVGSGVCEATGYSEPIVLLTISIPNLARTNGPPFHSVILNRNTYATAVGHCGSSSQSHLNTRFLV